jgi:hypothetical protein
VIAQRKEEFLELELTQRVLLMIPFQNYHLEADLLVLLLSFQWLMLRLLKVARKHRVNNLVLKL